MIQWLGGKLAGHLRAAESTAERQQRVDAIEAHVDVLEARVTQLEEEKRRRSDDDQ